MTEEIKKNIRRYGFSDKSYQEEMARTWKIADDYKSRIDKAIEYNEHLIEHAKYHLNLGHLKKMRKILKGETNE